VHNPQVLSDFLPFFANKSNAKAVYKPSTNAKLDFGHAIVLVGYNNEQGYWLAKNSYGNSWGDGGLFRVGLLLLRCCGL
jgi:C1A family cysteine protease